MKTVLKKGPTQTWDNGKNRVCQVTRVFAIFKMVDGGEHPGTSCKRLHESWSVLSRDGLDFRPRGSNMAT